MENSYSSRKYVIIGVIIITGIVFIIKLFSLQILSNKYRVSALNNSQRHIIQYPARGLIYDRDSTLIVSNKVAYDIMIVPGQVKQFDTVLFASQLDISVKKFREKINNAKEYSWYKPSVFYKLLNAKKCASLNEYIYNYEGFYVQPRLVRKYHIKNSAHILGDVGEVNKGTIEKDNYYNAGDYIGVNGIEKYYEKELRGKKGVKIYLVDAHNRIKESYENGRFDKKPVAGKNLQSAIDADLQSYGKRLMQKKIGGIVAIKPDNGEILAMISSPGYNPNLLVGRKRGYYYDSLLKADNKPLFNRATNSSYPPGSTFKAAQALIGLEEGVINTKTGFSCKKYLVGCHNHPRASSVKQAIQYSCNPYFYQVFKRLIQRGIESSVFRDSPLGLDMWKDKITDFGFNKSLDIGLPSVSSGHIPGSDYYDRLYGKYRWAFSTIYSLSIGQGEIGTTLLQLANFATTIANSGYFYTPHLIKNIEGKGLEDKYKVKHKTGINKKHFIHVKEGMEGAVNGVHGTASRARIKDVTVCGKTGTAENPHGEDHSIFMAFAPKEKPEIAIAVYVENSGYGGTWAAPIASLMIEKYLKDSISSQWKENRILNANLLDIEKDDEE